MDFEFFYDIVFDKNREGLRAGKFTCMNIPVGCHWEFVHCVVGWAKIRRAVGLINQLDDGKFPLLLSRILQKLHLKDEHAFSVDECEKLISSFNVTELDLQLIIETLEFIFRQAAYCTTKPRTLSDELIKVNLQDMKVNAITESWSNDAKDVIGKLRQRTLHPKQLDDVNWRLTLHMCQASMLHMKEPNAILELSVRDDNSGDKDRIQAEFTHRELYKFYNQLEQIQAQLDSLR